MPAKRQLRYDPDKDYYVALGVASTATPDEIQRAFRQQAKAVHPDVNPGNASAKQQFQALNDAYEVISNPYLRDEYDMQRRARLGYWEVQRPPPTPNAAPQQERVYVDLDKDQPDFTNWRPHDSIMRRAWRNMMRSYSHRLLFSVVAFVLIGNVCVILMLPHINFLLTAANIVQSTRVSQRLTLTVPVPTPTYEYTILFATSQPRTAAEPPPACSEHVQITSPVEGAEVNTDHFEIRGTATDDKFWSYQIEIDSTNNTNRWILQLPSRKPVPEQNGVLVENVSIGNMMLGEYILRLKVIQAGGTYLPACEIRIRRKQ